MGYSCWYFIFLDSCPEAFVDDLYRPLSIYQVLFTLDRHRPPCTRFARYGFSGTQSYIWVTTSIQLGSHSFSRVESWSVLGRCPGGLVNPQSYGSTAVAIQCSRLATKIGLFSLFLGHIVVLGSGKPLKDSVLFSLYLFTLRSDSG